MPEIARRLDGLPLALGLAAARVKALTPRQIVERLGHSLDLSAGGATDRPERQRTLRATIEWSYGLLAPKEQRLFARLAVFVGGCTVEAAEQVADADLDSLQSLVDKSLIRHTRERHWILESVREYASERLDESRERDQLRRRLAEYLLAFVEPAITPAERTRLAPLLRRVSTSSPSRTERSRPRRSDASVSALLME